MSINPQLRVQAKNKYAHIKPLPDPPKKPDAMQQRRNIVRAHTILEDYFSHRPDVLVNGEGYLCYDTRDRRNWTVPDCVVAFGVDPGAIDARNGYVISEVGKPPEFVLEVASYSTGHRDVTAKREIYAGHGIAEYWRFDQSGGDYHGERLAGDLLADGEYRPVQLNTSEDGVTWGYSPVLGLALCWHDGRLRIYDPVKEEYLPELSEAKAQARTAEAEVERLREELRRLGRE